MSEIATRRVSDFESSGLQIVLQRGMRIYQK